MALLLTLSSKKLLDKKFRSVPRGYDPLEVDEYLDKAINDYRIVESNVLAEKSEIDSLLEEIKKLKKENYDLQIENGKYKERFSNIKASDNVTSDNIMLMKKINKYESFLHRNGFNLKDIE